MLPTLVRWWTTSQLFAHSTIAHQNAHSSGQNTAWAVDSKVPVFAPLNAGVAADLSHVNTPAKVEGYIGEDQLAQALEGSEVVVIPAGVPRKPGTDRRFPLID